MKRKVLAFLLLASFALPACQNNNLNNLPVNQLQSAQIQASDSDSEFYSTAKNSFGFAEGSARSWDISAELVKAEAKNIDKTGKARWEYYFKSPFKRQVLYIDSYGRKRLVSDDFFGDEIREWDWKIDSSEAIKIAEKNGLKSFPVMEMTLEDNFSDPEWEMDTWDGHIRINARTGKYNKVNKK